MGRADKNSIKYLAQQEKKASITPRRYRQTKANNYSKKLITIFAMIFTITITSSILLFAIDKNNEQQADRKGFEKSKIVFADLTNSLKSVGGGVASNQTESCTITRPRLFGDKEKTNCSLHVEIKTIASDQNIETFNTYTNLIEKDADLTKVLIVKKSDTILNGQFDIKIKNQNRCFVSGKELQQEDLVFTIVCNISTFKPYIQPVYKI